LSFFTTYSKKLEYLISGVIFLITFAVYFSTMAPTVSFWDTGEFIATSHILGVPHPPGSPLFLLVGKFFSLIPISSDIAFRVNIFSPLISALTISLLFLICNQFIDRIDPNDNKFFKMWSSLTASLTFAFTHSHWFNAVETEVYAFSGFMTALVVFLIMRWSQKIHDSNHIIYLILISYIIGLATGLHLLNLLTIPFIGLIIYFSIGKLSTKNLILTFIFSLIIFFGIQSVIIKGLPQLTSSLGLVGLCFLIIFWVITTIYSIKSNKTFLSIFLSSVLLIVIGYSTYFAIFIRSGQNPNIDENNPETISEAISYLNRDQYGQMTILPRKFDNLPSKVSIVGSPADDNSQFSFDQELDYMFHDIPSQASFLWNYQIKKMYLRYFLWQFAGKGDSGDPFVASVGAFSDEDGVDWRQFGLPIALIMGLIGIGYHFRKNKQDAFSLLILFLMTGIAIIFYLNQDAPQPRERDYAYVASFMTFSIWIGLGVYSFINFITDSLLEKSIKLQSSYFMIGLFILFMPTRMLIANYHEHDRTGNYIAWDMAYNMLQTCEPNSILFTNGDNDTFPLWYLQEVEQIRTDVVVANLSLLNTTWYVEQLRERYKDNPFIKMSDTEIQRLDFKRWESKKISINAPKDSNNEIGKIEWELNPTYLGVALRIQDLMVLRIINDNNWNRPIYFGVTVSPTSMLNLDNYLQMEGLAYRLVNNSNQIINQNKMSDNLLSYIGDNSWFTDYDSNKYNLLDRDISKEYQRGYIFRNLANQKVYVDPQLGRLVQNYRTGFVRLSISHYLNKDFQKAEAVLLKMEEIMPSSIIPIPSKQLQYQIAQVYIGVGNQAKMKYHMKELVERKDLLLEDYILYGKTFIQLLEDYDESKLIFETIYQNYKLIEQSILRRGFTATKISEKEWQDWQQSLPEIIYLLFLSYKNLEMYDEAKILLNDWINKNPADNNAKELLEEILQLESS
jgi:tetratricopeptide (TPR) repeat protein